MLRFFKKKPEPNKIFAHYCSVCKIDKSGRPRYFLYKNGKLCREDLSVEGWGWTEK